MQNVHEVKSFRDLRTWQEAQRLAVEIYQLTEKFPPHEKYGLRSQIRAAAVSIPSNIAEGRGRYTPKEFVRFLLNARGSLSEVLSQLDFSARVNYCTAVEEQRLRIRYEGLNAGINSQISSLRKTFSS